MASASYIVSTCGTSLLTNKRSQNERDLVTKYSNEKERQTIPAQDGETLDAIIASVKERMAVANQQLVADLSAELKALIRFYNDQPFSQRDYHVLLCTDTWLGEEAARIVESWLHQQNCQVEVKREQDLQTANLDAFQSALSELVRWSEATLPERRQSGYRVIFNLTGGFKSVQGFLQTLAMFHADEVIYIFESQKELLRIPRLPVRMVATDAVRSNLTAIRRLAAGLPVDNIETIPETLLLRVGNSLGLSWWGELMWIQAKREIYEQQLWPSPSPRLQFGQHFERSLPKQQPDRLVLVNERIDDLARYVEMNVHLKSLDFKQLRSNPKPPSTHECDAWHDRDAQRLFGHYEGNVFILDLLDHGLH